MYVFRIQFKTLARACDQAGMPLPVPAKNISFDFITAGLWIKTGYADEKTSLECPAMYIWERSIGKGILKNISVKKDHGKWCWILPESSYSGEFRTRSDHREPDQGDEPVEATVIGSKRRL